MADLSFEYLLAKYKDANCLEKIKDGIEDSLIQFERFEDFQVELVPKM